MDARQKKSVVSYSDIDDLKKKIRVGDIFYTRPRSMKGKSLASKIFYKAESLYQGSPYTHTGLYVGGGKVVDAGFWGKSKDNGEDSRVHLVDLATFKDRYNFKVLRVNASSKERREAAQWAKKQVGSDFNTSGVIKMVLNPFKGGASRNRKRKVDNAEFFCSELVASAYAPHTGLATSRKLKHVLPGHIFRSPNTKTIAEFQKEAMFSAFADELCRIASSS